MRLLAFAAALVAVAPPVAAQVVNPAPALDNLATKAEMEAMAQLIPQPATTAPPIEMPGGSAGSAPTFRRGDAADNRIPRVGIFTAQANGMIGGTWDLPLPAGAASYPMFFTGIGPANTPQVKCKVVSSTNTAFSAQCTQDIASVVLAGSVSVVLATGAQVYALALPSTQPSR